MTRYVIHREDCPALCQDGCIWSDDHIATDHESHACSCNPPSPEELAELVEAAKCVLQDTDESWVRLGAARKPFTKENQ